MSADQQYIRWYHVYGSLECEPYGKLLDAAQDAWYSSEAGTSSEGCIEGPDGIVPEAEIEAIIKAENERRDAERAIKPPVPPIVARLMVLEPTEGNEGPQWRPKWAEYDSYRESNLDVLQREKDELIAMLGEDRVKVERLR